MGHKEPRKDRMFEWLKKSTPTSYEEKDSSLVSMDPVKRWHFINESSQKVGLIIEHGEGLIRVYDLTNKPKSEETNNQDGSLNIVCTNCNHPMSESSVLKDKRYFACRKDSCTNRQTVWITAPETA